MNSQYRVCIVACILLFSATTAGRSSTADVLESPKGLIAEPDSSGNIVLSWAYPGVDQAICSLGTRQLSDAYYLSDRPGEHQLACRFVLSGVRQWIDWAEVWVSRNDKYTENDWHTRGAIRIGLAADSGGFPGEYIVAPVEYQPASWGILSTGGFLRADIGAVVGGNSPDTVWLVLEWPSDFPDLVQVGVNDDSPGLDSYYRLDTGVQSVWRPFPYHIPLVRLGTLGYQEATEPLLLRSFATVSDVNSYSISRIVSQDGGTVGSTPIFGETSADTRWFRDSAVFAEHEYQYAVKALNDFESSFSCSVFVAEASPFNGQLIGPTQTDFTPIEKFTVTYLYENYEDKEITARVDAGWLVPIPGLNAGVGDTINLVGLEPSVLIGSGEISEVVAATGEGVFPLGLYDLTMEFTITDGDGRLTRFRRSGRISVADPTGIMDEQATGPPRSPELTVFPNPANNEAQIEFTLPGGRVLNSSTTGETCCQIDVFDILGRRVRRMAVPAINNASDHVSISFDGRDNYGNQLPSAVYFISVRSGSRSMCRKLVLQH